MTVFKLPAFYERERARKPDHIDANIARLRQRMADDILAATRKLPASEHLSFLCKCTCTLLDDWSGYTTAASKEAGKSDAATRRLVDGMAEVLLDSVFVAAIELDADFRVIEETVERHRNERRRRN